MKLITYPMFAVAIALAASWYILTPLLLLYGQYWSWANIFCAEDKGLLTRLAQCLLWDMATLVAGCLWLGSVAILSPKGDA